MKLSVVVPVYKEEKNIPEFVRRIVPILGQITQDFEIVFAMDPSPDRTQAVLEECHQKDSRIKYVLFSRRVGQPNATIGGLACSQGEAVVVMDVDLQDPPELILEMHKKSLEGYDVVLAQRSSRKGETLPKRVISYLGYMLINRIASVDIPPNTGDFRWMSRRVVNEIVAMKEGHGFLRGMVALVGFRQTAIVFDRPARFAGRGNYNPLWGSILIGMNGVVCFSNALLKLSTTIGFIISFTAFIVAIGYLVAKLMGAPFPMGNPTIVILVLFLGGVQLMSVGILGEYIGRIYDEVKQRPRFIIDKKVGL